MGVENGPPQVCGYGCKDSGAAVPTWDIGARLTSTEVMLYHFLNKYVGTYKNYVSTEIRLEIVEVLFCFSSKIQITDFYCITEKQMWYISHF